MLSAEGLQSSAACPKHNPQLSTASVIVVFIGPPSRISLILAPLPPAAPPPNFELPPAANRGTLSSRMRIAAFLVLSLAPLGQAGSPGYFVPAHRVSGIGVARDDISED